MTQHETLSLERRVAQAIRYKLTGGGCPTGGSLGECPAVYEAYLQDGGVRYFYAHIYLWTAGKHLKASEVARWVEDAGGHVMTINHQIHDPYNNVTDGFCEDGAISWLVEFSDKPASLRDAV